MTSGKNMRVANNSSGFALVITLMMLVIAAVIVVVFLASASIDRTTSASFNYRYQAELAVQNGLEAAKKIFVASPDAGNSITQDDSFIVFRVDGTQTNSTTGFNDSYYFLAKARTGGSTVDCYPLYAGGITSPLTINHTSYPPLQKPAAPSTANAARDAAGKPYPTLFSWQQGAFTQWQELRDPNDTTVAPNHSLPYMRYTFWIEDSAGYLDAAVVGNQNDAGGLHKRSNGTNANEIALFTLFEPAATTDSGSTLAKNIIDNRAVLFTGPTLQQVTSTTGPSDVTQPNLAVRLGIDSGGERNLIPFGFSYKDEGQIKKNLNTIISASGSSDAKVMQISTAISDNLPNFASRKGGFPATTGDDYLKSLAANMIDYVDTDSDATVGTGYRGIDAYPFIVEFFNRYNWEGSTNYYAHNGTWWAKVRVTGYVELWNMTNRDIKSGTFDFTDVNRYGVKVGSNDYKFDDHTGSVSFGATPLVANAFSVYQLYDKTYDFDSGVSSSVNPPSTTNSPVKLGQQGNVTAEHYESGYIAKWNGKIVDRAGAGSRDGHEPTGSPTGANIAYANLNYYGIQRKAATLQTAQSKLDPSWRGTYPGLRYDDLSEATYNVGDPRSAYYVAKNQAAVAYAKRPSDGASGTDGNSSWWGRAYQQGLIQASPQKWFAAETLISNWPDGDHTTTRGLLPPDTTVNPTDASLTPRPTTESVKAPIYISNSGSYSSITELGRIYDPIQWRPSAFDTKPASSSAVASGWNDAWKNDLRSDSSYGVGSTLRIGSPEFKQFDTDASRAARLLDLFSISDRIQTRGLVNLNTAGRDALRALAAGIQIQQDSAILPSSVYGPVASAQADKFADAVIASRPFLTTSQLSGVLSTPTDITSKFFGNVSQWSTNPPQEWNDSAREEYFARIFNLTSVRSRNFRVFVTGQSLDKYGVVLSTVSRVFQVYLNPTRDASGAITSQQVQVTYEKAL